MPSTVLFEVYDHAATQDLSNNTSGAKPGAAFDVSVVHHLRTRSNWLGERSRVEVNRDEHPWHGDLCGWNCTVAFHLVLRRGPMTI